ncbi:heavy-metal-associated domain-containing protein [Thiocapsa imhoffii]
MKQIIAISGMSCQHCVRAVTEALEATAGVEQVVVDLAAGTAEVQGPAAAEDVLAAVSAAGYEARIEVL